MQMTGQFRAILLACLVVLSPQQAHAEDAILAITMVGEAYEGTPKFQILADKITIGTGEIAHAVDTSKGNRLKLPTDFERSTGERFVFAVPDIQNVSQFEIVFTNDAWAGTANGGSKFIRPGPYAERREKRRDRDRRGSTGFFASTARGHNAQPRRGRHHTALFCPLSRWPPPPQAAPGRMDHVCEHRQARANDVTAAERQSALQAREV